MKTPELKNAATPPAVVGGQFLALLQQKTGGVSLGELDDALTDLVRAVQHTDRPGTLTLKLKISPNGRGVKLEDELTIKEPKPTRGVSFAFVGPGGVLTRNDPNQQEMRLEPLPQDNAAPLAAVR